MFNRIEIAYILQNQNNQLQGLINNFYKEIEKMIVASFNEKNLEQEYSLIDNDQFINLYHLLLAN